MYWPRDHAMLVFRAAGQKPGGKVETGMGRRERLPHIWTGGTACPTFVSLRFVGGAPIRDKVEPWPCEHLRVSFHGAGLGRFCRMAEGVGRSLGSARKSACAMIFVPVC